MDSPILAIIASVTVVLAFWRKLAGLLWRMASAFVGEVVIVESALTQALRAYGVSHLRIFPWRRRRYSALNVYVRPKNSLQAVAFEEMNGTRLLFKGWAPLLLREDPKARETALAYVRGTLDVEALLLEALDHWTGLLQSQRLRRFTVVHIVGRAGSVHATQDDAQSKMRKARPAHVFHESRLLRWTAEDLGPELSAGNALDHFIAPPEVLETIEEAKFWVGNARWFRERSIPWRRGWLLHGPPGTGKTSLARALAQDLDLPVFAFDLSSLTSEEMRRAWSDMLRETPCMALLEDVDTVFEGRRNVTPRHDGLSFNVLLNCVDGVERCDGVFVIITTNRLEAVDPALGVSAPDSGYESCRPGRVDRVIGLRPPGEDGLVRIAQRLLPHAPQRWGALAAEGARAGHNVAQFQEHCARLALQEMEDLRWRSSPSGVSVVDGATNGKPG